jgi:hypothetical protein
MGVASNVVLYAKGAKFCIGVGVWFSWFHPQIWSAVAQPWNAPHTRELGSNVTPLPPFNTFGKFQPHTVSPVDDPEHLDCFEHVDSLSMLCDEGVTKAK